MGVAMHRALMHCGAMADYQAAVRAYLQRVMKEKSLSQTKLAEMAGVTQSTIQRALDPDYPYETKAQTLLDIQARTGIDLPATLLAKKSPPIRLADYQPANDTPEALESAVITVDSVAFREIRGVLAPIFAGIGVPREYWDPAAEGILRGIEAAKTLNPPELQDFYLEIAAEVQAAARAFATQKSTRQ